MQRKKIRFCECMRSDDTLRLDNEEGHWLVCRQCGRAVEDSYRQFETT